MNNASWIAFSSLIVGGRQSVVSGKPPLVFFDHVLLLKIEVVTPQNHLVLLKYWFLMVILGVFDNQFNLYLKTSNLLYLYLHDLIKPVIKNL